MSARKLRSKLEQVRHFLPLKRTRSPTGAGLSEKMLQPLDGNVAIAHDLPPPPPPPKDLGEWNEVRHAIEAVSVDHPQLASPGSQHVIFLSRQMKRPPSYSKLPALPSEMGELPPPSPTVPPKPARARAASSRIPVAASRLTAAERRAATISTPEEAELRRREAQRRKEEEEREALREEAQRQARLKREKERALQQYAEDEAARKAALDAELRRAAEDRRRREAAERESEALGKMLVEERKREDRERRRQEAERMQQRRKEIEERNRAPQKEREAWRERTTRERHERAGILAGRAFKTERGLTVLLTGWVTVQSEDCLSWKRRYFQLREDGLVLFKDAEVGVPSSYDTARLKLMRAG